jgi:hypothetical protein
VRGLPAARVQLAAAAAPPWQQRACASQQAAAEQAQAQPLQQPDTLQLSHLALKGQQLQVKVQGALQDKPAASKLLLSGGRRTAFPLPWYTACLL